MLAANLAFAAAALFAGAALYISIAEHPARLSLDDEAAAGQWQSSYARGSLMQASLALAGGALALWIWWHSLNQLWLIGGLTLLANWPFTLLAIRPVNRRLEAVSIDAAQSEARPLLERWGRLHWVRTGLGAASVLAMLCALLWRL